MLDYVREMLSFYPNADGLMIEASDYAICHCPKCGPRFFDNEFDFVNAISDEVWPTKPDATIVVYTHYFTVLKCPALTPLRPSNRSTPAGGYSLHPHTPTSTRC